METNSSAPRQETKSDNELIANFMGYTHVYTKKGKTYQRSIIETVDPRYDPEWDWNLLMDVVEKIQELFMAQVDQSNKVSKQQRRKDIEFSKVICLPITAGLNLTYESVVNFIKWFNQQNHGQ